MVTSYGCGFLSYLDVKLENCNSFINNVMVQVLSYAFWLNVYSET
jgi:hypothetical protein